MSDDRPYAAWDLSYAYFPYTTHPSLRKSSRQGSLPFTVAALGSSATGSVILSSMRLPPDILAGSSYGMAHPNRPTSDLMPASERTGSGKRVLLSWCRYSTNACNVAGVGATGAAIVRRSLRGHSLIHYVAKLPACVIAMGACSRSTSSRLPVQSTRARNPTNVAGLRAPVRQAAGAAEHPDGASRVVAARGRAGRINPSRAITLEREIILSPDGASWNSALMAGSPTPVKFCRHNYIEK